MRPDELFLAADADLRSVIDTLTPEQLAMPAPPEWTSLQNPTLRDIVFAHTYDERWVPDVLAGKASSEGDPLRDADLLGDDPIGAYDRANEAATAAVHAGVADDAVFRFSYGDYDAGEGYAHLATYRAFQAWLIAKLVGLDFALSDATMTGLEQHVVPNMDAWREFGVFPPAVESDRQDDRETRLLKASGHWHE